MFKLDVAGGRMLHMAGAIAMGFSLVMGLVVLFVIPGNSYFSGMVILILGFTFAFGLFMFLLGQFVLWKPRLETAFTALAAMIVKLF